MQALLNLSKIDQGLSVFVAGGDGTFRFRELPGLSQLTIDTVSDSLYARAVRRLQVGVRNQLHSLSHLFVLKRSRSYIRSIQAHSPNCFGGHYWSM
jgi:hypothetical protein